MSVLDPFDVVGLVRGRDRVERFWEGEGRVWDQGYREEKRERRKVEREEKRRRGRGWLCWVLDSLHLVGYHGWIAWGWRSVRGKEGREVVEKNAKGVGRMREEKGAQSAHVDVEEERPLGGV